MTGRWREENCFRYGRASFDLDSLVAVGALVDDAGKTRGLLRIDQEREQHR